MSTPPPGLKIYIESDGQVLEYLDKTGNILRVSGQSIPVTNYEYEIKENDKKRQILVLKPEYISVVTSELKNILKYSESSQYIDSKTKRVYNPRKYK